MVFSTKEQILIDADSKEYNPTLFSVFITSQLERMATWEVISYIFILFIASLFNIVCLIVVARSTVFHNNLQFTIWWTAFAWFELAAGKCLTIIYQNYFIDEDLNRNGVMLLAWSASTHYHFIFLVLASPLMFIIERGLATNFLLDYEKRKRRWILLTILLFQNSFSGTLTILTILNMFRYFHAAIIGGIAIAVSSLGFIYLNSLNRSKLKSIEHYNQNLSFNLSAKYQLRENIKTFEMIGKMFLTVVITISSLIILKTVPMIVQIPDDRKFFFRRITDMIVHAGPIFVTLTMLTAVKDYGIVAKRLFGIQQKKILPILDEKTKQGDIYFEQFKLALK